MHGTATMKKISAATMTPIGKAAMSPVKKTSKDKDASWLLTPAGKSLLT